MGCWRLPSWLEGATRSFRVCSVGSRQQRRRFDEEHSIHDELEE